VPHLGTAGETLETPIDGLERRLGHVFPPRPPMTLNKGGRCVLAYNAAAMS